ncbi:MAG: hypothetical protein FGM54_04025 [Chitinophagaceae bacterium]|nr:hypothetical protein [Chitinophagaceae bacterium]
MKVLIFDTWLAPFHVGTALEIAETHKEKGDEVQYVNIAASLPFIEVHHANKRSEHWVLRKKYANIKAMCKRGGVPCSFKTGLSPWFNFSLPPHLQTIADLKAWEYEGLDLGMAILSSLISKSKDIEPDLVKYRSALNQIAHACIKTLASFKYWCNKFNPDRVYFVNGRTALTRPMLRYCELNGIDFRTHERGGNENMNSYSIHTTFLHDLESYNRIIEAHWEESRHTEDERIAIADAFFARLRSGKKQWIAFHNLMQEGLLPPEFDTKNYNVVFFTSSITEFAAIDSRNNTETLFPSQFESVRFIANTLAGIPNVKFYVRLHPNTKKAFKNEYQRWLTFLSEMGDKLIWIDGDSGVDSYSLMRMCNKVLVSYSTIGIEASYYDKPVIATMKARYHKLGSTYSPANLDELRTWLIDRQLPPKPRIGAMKFAYFQMTWGIPFKYYTPESRFKGKYRGVDLDAINITRFDRFIMACLNRFKIDSL